METFIEALNEYIEQERLSRGIKADNHLVLHKSITPTRVHAYKKYDYVLWDINGKFKHPVIGAENTDKVVTEEDKKKLEKLVNKKFFSALINLLRNKSETGTLERIIKGEFYGNE